MSFERFSHHAAALEPDAPESAPDQNRVVSSRNSYTIAHEGTAGGSVAQTLRREGAQGFSVELVPGDPNSRTSAAVAARMGVLREQAGTYVDVGSTDRLEAQQAIQADFDQGSLPVPDVEAFPVAAEEVLQAAVEPLPQHSYDNALSQLTALAVYENGSLEQIGARIATSSGMLNHGDGTAVAHVIAKHFETAAARALEQVGVVGKERQAAFLQDARDGNRAKFGEAVQKLVHGRDPSGIKAMGQVWADRNPDGFVQGLREAGFEVARDPTGGWLHRSGQGPWIPVAALLAASR